MEKLKGYRQLSDAEIAIINEIKAKAEEVGELILKAEERSNTDRRWSAVAKTDLQKGFMALTRSIARPESF